MCVTDIKKQNSKAANHVNGNGVISNGNGNGVISNGNGNGVISNRNGNGVISNGSGNGVIINNVNHSTPNKDGVINVDRGDPKMYYPFWKKVDDKCQVTIKASELMSYFADDFEDGVFYQLPEFRDAVRRIHRKVGNAITEGRYIIGGTGSSQLFNVALRALASTIDASTQKTKRLPVVCAGPYYSCYEEALEEENSAVYQWKGDANSFNEEGPYIEVVTTPNNPDGSIRKPVVKKEGGLVICDLAYYWPQYTPITAPADYDVMLFTLSKATGHAGSRVGWAIVKDKEIAMRMIKLMALVTIGSCHEGQLRAAKLLDFVVDSYDNLEDDKPVVEKSLNERLFEFSHSVLADRWMKLRTVVKRSGVFKLPDYCPEHCNFMNKFVPPNPAYAWMESKTGEDASKLMSELNIQTRAGPKFGASSKFTRVSMMESNETFNRLIERLSTLQE